MNVTQVGDSAVIAVVNDDGLWFYWQAIGTAAWHAEQVAGPGVVIGGSSVAQVGGSAVIAVTQQDNNLWFYWQAIGAAPWNPELVGPGGA
jgi:hypothetical protein